MKQMNLYVDGVEQDFRQLDLRYDAAGMLVGGLLAASAGVCDLLARQVLLGKDVWVVGLSEDKLLRCDIYVAVPLIRTETDVQFLSLAFGKVTEITHG